ncbi:hydrogenase maturation protease [Methylolobus aquaticus]
MSMIAAAIQAPVLVFGYGNPSRGDDALAPLLLQALRSDDRLAGASDQVEFLTDFQLQVEHALDLAERSVVLFADAHVSCPAPFTFTRLSEARDDSYTTHAMSPAAVLHVYRQVCGRAPPPCYLLSIRGQQFELGEPLGDEARDHLEAAVAFARDLLSDTTPARWQTLAGSG